MPESFHGLRWPDSRDSMLARDTLEALLDACLNNELEELLPPFLRLSRNEDRDEMLPGLRNLSKMDRCSPSSPN